MTVSFTQFVPVFMKAISTHDGYGGRIRQSMAKGVYDTGRQVGDGALLFDAHSLDASVFGGNEYRLAQELARDLNSAYGAAEPEPEAVPQPAGRRRAEPPPAPANGSPAAPSASSVDPGSAWEYPVFDYSRAPVADPAPTVSVSERPDGSLLYTWPDPGDGEVFRVVISDHEIPYDPDEADATVTATREDRAADPTPLTTAVRFVSVWGYQVFDPASADLGQARLVAEGTFVAPVQDWELTYGEQDRAVFSTWTTPIAPTQAQVRVRAARLPAGQSRGPFMRGGWTAEHLAVPTQSAGFQDTGAQVGVLNVYVAAVEVQVDGRTLLSRPLTREVTPTAGPDRITDLRVEPMSTEEPNRLRLIWTQRPTTTVHLYATEVAPRAEAVSQQRIERGQLPGALLPDERLLPHAVERTGMVSGEGTDQRVQCTIADFAWPEGESWDTLHLTPVSENGPGHVLIGSPVRRKRAGSVQAIRVVQRLNWQLVTFAWPGGAAEVDLRIGGTQDRFDPDVPAALGVDKEKYTRDGGFVIPGGLPPEGCRLFLTATTYQGGARVHSEPAIRDVGPLWQYRYTLDWPGESGTSRPDGLRGRLGRRTARAFGRTAVRLGISATRGHCPEGERPSLVLVHHAQHVPLYVGDGTVVPLLTEQPGDQSRGEQVTSVTAPSQGRELDLWFEPGPLGTGYFRLLVDARPAATLDPERGRTALERYALVDPALGALRGRG
jgi:hypothetical protein